MKPSISRRVAMRLLGGAVLSAPFIRGAQAAAPRVVIIGGGAGGATAARTLAASRAGLDVTLITPDPRYTTCFFSNLYIAGLRPLEAFTHSYQPLASRHRVKLLQEVAAVIDPIGKSVRLADGGALSYDRLVVAPGIGFRWDAIDGYGRAAPQIMPHAWKAGPQSRLLRRQLEAMDDGGLFLIAPPEDPYRCPSAPYERVSLIAHYFRRAKPRSKIIILDAKDSIPLQPLFEEGWARFYGDMIEVIPAAFAGGVQAVDVHAGTVMSLEDTFRPDVVNIIPPQLAGRLAQETGLADGSGWCPVDPTSFESTRIPGIHVIGDAAIASPMPKAGYVAAQQAAVCATAIELSLAGRAAAPPEFGGACWTHLAPDHAVSERAAFAVNGGRIQRTALAISATGEGDDIRAAAAAEAKAWYRDITGGMFG